ncbi:uncharacterized protein AKAW2_21550S [Aspergillus luchuensis]|uniref:Uncharacterized protein n=1 Tax=Aspergillus kawachii TaxID=1069201 RepID=A0A7R7W594_ASPKA|nr:uncharacterized protein AKAW2_21550S [Aspergillus luchuensis]BCR96610.1 hypothetical protein AKAW2_21550S [Aspergillus luchuensis]
MPGERGINDWHPGTVDAYHLTIHANITKTDARLGPPKQYCDQPCLLHTTRTNIHNTEHSLMTTFLSRVVT